MTLRSFPSTSKSAAYVREDYVIPMSLMTASVRCRFATFSLGGGFVQYSSTRAAGAKRGDDVCVTHMKFENDDPTMGHLDNEYSI